MHTGLAVITGTEDRQHAYVALTRGTDDNTAYVFTPSPKRADPAPGPRPAPELARYDRLTADGQRSRARPPRRRAEDALGVLAEVLGRDGQQLSASQTCSRPWPTPTTWPSCTPSGPPRPPRPASSATGTCSRPPCRPATAPDPATRRQWLWRTLRAAELAGLDPAQVLADAVGERDLTGARDIAAVIDARIRRRTGTLVPLPARPWSAQLPAIADPERRAYADQIAALMDARKQRIGEHAADAAPALGGQRPRPGPRRPAARLEWQQRAASIGAYRELSGYDHPADPIGPEPAAAAPDLRAAWHEALAALGPADGPDVRGMPDGLLLHLRDTYPIETAWAPPWVGDELRQVRAAARDARLAALRAAAEAARRPAAAATPASRPAAGTGRQLPGHAATPTGNARPRSPRPWPTGPTGSTPPATSGSWPSPPTPNCAAATPASPAPRCAPPNPRPPPAPSATSPR